MATTRGYLDEEDWHEVVSIRDHVLEEESGVYVMRVAQRKEMLDWLARSLNGNTRISLTAYREGMRIMVFSKLDEHAGGHLEFSLLNDIRSNTAGLCFQSFNFNNRGECIQFGEPINIGIGEHEVLNELRDRASTTFQNPPARVRGKSSSNRRAM